MFNELLVLNASRIIQVKACVEELRKVFKIWKINRDIEDSLITFPVCKWLQGIRKKDFD